MLNSTMTADAEEPGAESCPAPEPQAEGGRRGGGALQRSCGMYTRRKCRLRARRFVPVGCARREATGIPAIDAASHFVAGDYKS